ncbi:hypothetical protein GGR06_002792 [Bacteroides reticulotermitis]|uniref:Uncharacterized protein n=1 Tax=Bacteroides reticulotermitis TaxID=1133319 RepID=A0A840CYQ4_9BACE|nr:hypothetical protein [Bacteroides reticulotermitis]
MSPLIYLKGIRFLIILYQRIKIIYLPTISLKINIDKRVYLNLGHHYCMIAKRLDYFKDFVNQIIQGIFVITNYIGLIILFSKNKLCAN